MGLCPDCNEVIVGTDHECQPTFFVWCADVHPPHRTGQAITARSHRDAAQNWAAIRGQDVAHFQVSVRKATGTHHERRPIWFDISGELVMQYLAAECEPPADADPDLNPTIPEGDPR